MLPQQTPEELAGRMLLLHMAAAGGALLVIPAATAAAAVVVTGPSLAAVVAAWRVYSAGQSLAIGLSGSVVAAVHLAAPRTGPLERSWEGLQVARMSTDPVSTLVEPAAYAAIGLPREAQEVDLRPPTTLRRDLKEDLGRSLIQDSVPDESFESPSYGIELLLGEFGTRRERDPEARADYGLTCRPPSRLDALLAESKFEGPTSTSEASRSKGRSRDGDGERGDSGDAERPERD